MTTALAPVLKSHRALPQPRFDRVALVLQGGGALGAYQGGVYEALDEAGIALDWIAGVSIGAINGALIAGNRPEDRLARLRDFWLELSTEPWCLGWLQAMPKEWLESDSVRTALNQMSAAVAMTLGVRSLYAPRIAPAWFWPPGSRNAVSLYDAAPLADALKRFVDFDRINAGPMRFSVSAVNIRTGNFDYFDTATGEIRLEHILASAALPPVFPPVEIDGERYWDGGIVSNTPLQWIAESEPHRDTLVFQVDLWNTLGEAPMDLAEAMTRQKEIQYASRTRAGTDAFRRVQRLKNVLAEALEELPGELRSHASLKRLEQQAIRNVFQIVHLIYHARPHHGTTKDFEFSRLNIDEHWAVGHNDATRTLRHPEALARPDLDGDEGVSTFDVAVDGRL